MEHVQSPQQFSPSQSHHPPAHRRVVKNPNPRRNPKPFLPSSRPISSRNDFRRKSDTQLLLSHPIISRSLQQVQNQPKPRASPPLSSPPRRHRTLNPSSRTTLLHPMPGLSPEPRQTYQPISSGKLTSRPNHKPRQTSGVTSSALSRNPSLSTISSKSSQAPAVIIKHGLPSPPPTVLSDNSSWPGRAAAVQPDASLLKNRPPSVRSHLTNATNHTPHPPPPPKNHPPLSSPPPTSTSAPYHPLHTQQPPNPAARRPARDARRSSWATASMKAVTDHLSPVYPRRSGSTLSSATSATRPSTSHPTSYNSSSSTSIQSPTADGPMPSSSSHLDSTPSSKPQDLTSLQQTTDLSISVLSNATVRPKIRSPSESSSTDLRVSKLKFKDRSKDPSTGTLNEDSQSASRSKKLATMKERNERIFASINASLNPTSRTGSVEPPLPPPPPSTSSASPMSPPGSIPFPASTESSHLKVPARTGSLSGLIPFAQGSSPNPRKVTASQPPATIDKTDPSLLAMDSETADDEHFGSVRHKRPERCRLVKRTSTSDSADDLLKHKPPPSETGSTASRIDDWTNQVQPKHSRYFDTALDRPMSANTDHSNFPSDGRSETISMHTTSSDTIGGHGRSGVPRSSSRNSIASYRADSVHTGGDHFDEDQINFSDDQEAGKPESLMTPVKNRRSDSLQKTLRHATSVSEMLHANSGLGDIAPTAWTPRAAASVRTHRASSSHHHPAMAAPAAAAFSPPQANTTLVLSNSQGISRSPQSHASLSRRQRPGLPDQFVLSHQPDRVDHDIRSMAETHPSELSSLLSPRSNRTRLTHSTSLRQQTNAESRAYRHSDTFVPAIDRVNGVESALSRYDGHHSFSDRRKYPTNRNKHASWSVLEESGKDLPRSQSVLGGAYDPRLTESREAPVRPRTSHMSPLSRRYATRANGLEDEDDDQTSTTTYTNIHSMPRKPGSADSRSRTSEWGFEDQEHRNRSVHSASRLTNSLYMSPSRRKSTLEKDRTLRGNGGAVVPTPKPFTQLLRNTYQEKNSPYHNTDTLSSSSGTTSSKRLQSQRSANHGPSPSARMNDSANRHSRPPTRSASMAAIGLTALLSPTPTVDHHNLLISAYEALDCHQEEHSKETRDLHSALNGLLSSVVKNSCKIDATLAQLSQSSLNHQVEMELADDYIDDEHDPNLHSKQSSSEHITRQKYFMMKESLAHMAKVQGQLVRTSNDHMRDLTEVLICLSKLHRANKEPITARQAGVAAARVSGSDDPREFYSYADTNPKDYVRSGSRAGAGYSRSHSPSKLRHTIDLSPLSVISSHDGSPLSKANAESPLNPVNHAQRLAASITSPRLQHNRASTISFAHQRYLSIDGLPPQLARAQKRTSAVSCTSINQMRDAPSHPQRSESRASMKVDEFGLYRKASDQTLKSPLEFKYPKQQEESWSRSESARNTIRGSQPSAVFPKTPTRVATASLSHANAHSNVSPTRPHRESIDGRSQRFDRDVGGIAMRPSSSMSKVLDRAHHALSRTGHYPTVSAVHSGRRENGNISERYSRGPSPEETRTGINRRNESNGRMSVADIRMDSDLSLSSRPLDGKRKGEEQQQQHNRISSSTTATAALERLSLNNKSGVWNNSSNYQHRRNEEVSRKASGSTGSHLPSSNSTGTSSHSIDDTTTSLEFRKDVLLHNHLPIVRQNSSLTTNNNTRRSRKGSIQKLFGGLKRNHSLVKN